MRRLAIIISSLAFVALFASSCTEQETEISFDESLIIGKWQNGTLFERYDSDNSGATWDTADDVTEDEAQGFTWTIVKDQLELIHIMESGESVVPKTYTITTLTATTFEYHDDSGKTILFSKAQ